MTRCSRSLLAGLCLAALGASAQAVVLTGEVRAIDAQQILTRSRTVRRW